MNEKICALIRQTWYETAKKNLKPEERLRFYESCFEYEFGDSEPADDLPFAARLLFDMVKDEIDKDKERARIKAETSRRNGRQGGRPKLTEVSTDEENPTKPTGLFKTSNIQNNTQQNTTEHNNDSVDEDTHKFFECCLILFERGCSNPEAEANTFWNYYASLGWKTKNGGDIVDKLALAKAWRLSEISTPAIKRRRPWADLIREVKPTELDLLSQFVDMTKDQDTKQVIVTMQTKEVCMIFENKYIWKAKTWFMKWAPGYSLQYRALQTSL